MNHRLSLAGLVLSLATVNVAGAALPPMAPVTAADSLLIVAPHPDDESLCCGGLIYMARAVGAKVSIVWITSGDAFRWDAMRLNRELFPPAVSYLSLARQRTDEAREAARILNVDHDSIYFLGYPDRGVSHLMGNYYEPPSPWRSHYTGARHVIYPDAFEPGAPYDGASLTHDFEAVLDRVHPTMVFAPSLQDAHPDHRGAGLLVSRTLAARGELGELRFWIVHGGHGWPAHGYEPLAPQTIAPRGTGLQWRELRLAEDSEAAKLQAISAHQSQVRVMGRTMRRYVRSTELYALSPVASAARR